VRESGTVNAQMVSQRSQVHACMRPVSLVCRIPGVVRQYGHRCGTGRAPGAGRGLWLGPAPGRDLGEIRDCGIHPSHSPRASNNSVAAFSSRMITHRPMACGSS
jgi:hypothetical protein